MSTAAVSITSSASMAPQRRSSASVESIFQQLHGTMDRAWAPADVNTSQSDASSFVEHTSHEFIPTPLTLPPISEVPSPRMDEDNDAPQESHSHLRIREACASLRTELSYASSDAQIAGTSPSYSGASTRSDLEQIRRCATDEDVAQVEAINALVELDHQLQDMKVVEDSLVSRAQLEQQVAEERLRRERSRITAAQDQIFAMDAEMDEKEEALHALQRAHHQIHTLEEELDEKEDVLQATQRLLERKDSELRRAEAELGAVWQTLRQITASRSAVQQVPEGLIAGSGPSNLLDAQIRTLRDQGSRIDMRMMPPPSPKSVRWNLDDASTDCGSSDVAFPSSSASLLSCSDYM